MKFCLSLLLCLTSTLVFAQLSGITENGDAIVLYDNGTWKYEDETLQSAAEDTLVLNPTVFTKPKKASFNLRSKKTDHVFSYNPKLWEISDVSNQAAEYTLKMRDTEGYAMMIVEEIGIPVENLAEIAITNARNLGKNIEVVTKEYRTVNGLRVIHLEIEGDFQSIPFTYYGYYHSTERGSLQFVAYTARNLMPRLRPQMEELLNGLSVE